jgi:predicted small metal-binding protein
VLALLDNDHTTRGGEAMREKKVACDCGKVIRESSDDALVAAVQKHAKEVHDMDLSREQVLAMAEPEAS